MFSPYDVSPLWFRYTDAGFTLLAFLATFAIMAYSFRIYRLTKMRAVEYLTVAFAFIFIGFGFQGLADFSLWYEPNHVWFGEWLQPYGISEGAIYLMLMLGAMAFTLAGYLTLTGLFLRARLKNIILMIALFVTTLVSGIGIHYGIYHAILVIVLAVLVIHYYERAQQEKKWLAFKAFLLLLTSQILFTFVFIHPLLYVAAHISRIAGFLLLAYNLYAVFRHGRQ